MARIEDIERRLQNWARWRHGAGEGGLGYGSTWRESGGGNGGYREAVIPTVDCEASETDLLVQALEQRLRATVQQVYLTADSPHLDAAHLGVSVSTLKMRIWEAHRQLSIMLSARRAAALAERTRVEALIRAGRASCQG